MSAKLFTIEIFFKHDNEVKREVLRNITGAKLKEFRETFFTVGFAVIDPADAKHWIIISPFRITQIDVWLQSKFYNDGDNTKKN
jgi:hypothetical protein